ncbi:MAG: hypothetical protein IPN94_27050 [Sphingobacteriales bacterium]|nr:hypothetical protein [Sphingobacteriales bacterium]
MYVRNTATGCIVSQSGVAVNCGACAGTVVASSNSPVCTGSAILLTSTISGGTATSYSWSGPAGVSTFLTQLLPTLLLPRRVSIP